MPKMSDKRFNNKNLKAAINKSGMTREQIAEKVGCDTSSITKYYNGDRYPKTDIIIKLAELFKCSTDYLLGVSNVATVDKDVQFICNYTGLKEETVNFFVFNKSFESQIEFNKTAIDFIEFLVDKIYSKPIFSIEIETLREITTVLYMKYEERIAKAPLTPLDFDNEKDVNDVIDELINQRIVEKEQVEQLKDTINAQKYTLSRFLNNCLDEFAVSNIGGITVSDFDLLEDEYYRDAKNE